MKNIKRFNEEIGNPNWPNPLSEYKTNTVRVTIEMSDESARELQRYFDCSSAKSAISEHLSSLNELEGVSIDVSFN